LDVIFFPRHIQLLKVNADDFGLLGFEPSDFKCLLRMNAQALMLLALEETPGPTFTHFL
jgi:hypothetical protein